MNTTEFFYWLQGYFELTGRFINPLDSDQVECIERHIDLIGAPEPRVFEVKALLRLLGDKSTPPTSNPEMRARITSEIKLIVSAQFQHVIDQKAGPPEVQTHLNHLHNPGKPFNVRC